MSDKEDGEDEYAYMIRAALLKLPQRQGTIPMVYAYIEVRVPSVHSSMQYSQSGQPHYEGRIHVKVLFISIELLLTTLDTVSIYTVRYRNVRLCDTRDSNFS